MQFGMPIEILGQNIDLEIDYEYEPADWSCGTKESITINEVVWSYGRPTGIYAKGVYQDKVEIKDYFHLDLMEVLSEKQMALIESEILYEIHTHQAERRRYGNVQVRDYA